MIEWILSKLFKRKYFTSVDYSNGKDYTVICHGYRDKNNIVHVLKYSVFE